MCLVRVNAQVILVWLWTTASAQSLARQAPPPPTVGIQASLSQISYAKTEETKRQVDSSTYDASIYRDYFHIQGEIKLN